MEEAAAVAQRPELGPEGVNAVAMKRLRSIEGQVRGIQKMVASERYCMDIVDQISAVRAALAKVSEEVVRRHIETCVVHDLREGSPSDQDRVIEELMTVVGRQMK